MGYGRTMFIIFFVISVGMSLINPSEWGSPLTSIWYGNSVTGEVNIDGLKSQIKTLLTLSIVSGAIASLFKQDMMTGIIVGIATFLLGFTFVPINFFANANIPFFIKVLVGVPLGLIYLLGVLDWFRGYEF